MTAQSWHAIPLLIGLATSFGCSHPVAAPIAVLPEDPPDNEEIAPIREPSIRLGSRKFRHQLVGQALVFSPDGKTLYSGGSDGTVKAWDVETGDARQSFAAHKGAVSSLALSPDGQVLATGGADGAVVVWDTATGKQSWQSSAHKKGVTTVGFSPDCKTVVSAGRQDSIVRLWVSSTGKESSRITTDEDFLLRAFFSPDGQSLATVGYPFGAICLWKIAGGSLVRRIGSSHEVACFSADGKLLLAGGSVEDNSVTLWDVDTGKECPQSPEPKHGRVVRAVAFAPDGKRFAIGESFGLASVWDTNTGKQVLALEGHFGSVEAIAFSPDGKLLATGGYDGVVRLFNSATGQQLRPPDGHQAMVSALALTPDGKTLVSGGHDRSIRFWEMPGGRPIRTLTWERGKEWHRTQADVLSLSVSDDGKRLASSDSDGPVRLWELASGKQIRIIDKCPLSSTVAWIRGGDTLLLGGGDGMIGVWSADTGQQVKAFDRMSPVWELALSPDEATFACTGSLHPFTSELRSARTGALLATFTFPPDNETGTFHTTSTFLAFSPDGKSLAMARGNEVEVVRHPLRLFDLATKKEILAFGSGQVTALAFTPDGRTIVSAGAGGVISLWDRATGARKDCFGTGQWAIRSLVFSSDGRMLYSGGDDGTICGWNVRRKMN